MNSLHRKVFFYITGIIFIILGTYLVLVMKGLVISNGSFSPTGGIFLNVSPSRAALFVNGERYPISSSLFNTGTLVTELPEGKYHLLVANDGSTSWEKILSVSPGRVAARNFVRLFPATPTSTKISSSTIQSFVDADGKFIFETASGTLDLGDGVALAGFTVTASNATSKTIICSKNRTLFSLDSHNPDNLTNLSALFLRLGIAPTSVIPHPFSPQKIVVASGKNILTVDTKREVMEKITSLPQNIVAVGTSGSSIFAVGGGKLAIADLVFGTVDQYSVSLVPKKITPSPSGSYVAMENAGILAVIDPTATTTNIISTKAEVYSFSPEERRFASISGNTLTVWYLDEWHTDLQKKAGAKTTITLPINAPITNLTWLDPQHVLILSQGNILAVEIDDELPINTATIASHVKSFSYRYGEDVLHVLTEGGSFEEVSLR